MRLKLILCVLALACLMLNSASASGGWGNEMPTGDGPRDGWLAEGFGPCAIYPGHIKFVTTYRWDDYEYLVPVREVAAALDAGLFEPSPGYKTMADMRVGNVRTYLNRYNQRGWEWVYFDGEDPPTTVSGWNSMGLALYERGKYEERTSIICKLAFCEGLYLSIFDLNVPYVGFSIKLRPMFAVLSSNLNTFLDFSTANAKPPLC